MALTSRETPTYIGEVQKDRGHDLGLADIADTLLARIEDQVAASQELLFEPVIRLGVTGLSRAGKTVFITALVANLRDGGRLPQFQAMSSGRLEAAFLRPQPDDTVPRFDFEARLGALKATPPEWPGSTTGISQLRLTFRVAREGFIGGLRGPRHVHLDIVDYPGEWLLDLPLMDKSFADWSAEMLARAETREHQDHASTFLQNLNALDPTGALDEAALGPPHLAFCKYLTALRGAGFSALAPGRFLMPGDMQGSPALTFFPMAKPEKTPRGGIWRELERRFEAYKSQVVKPFFRDHFSRIDRQIVLVDALEAIHGGPAALSDLQQAMEDVLRAFRPGQNSWLARLTGRRVERILFAATKADHLHHHQHPRLTAIMDRLLADARTRADFAGAKTGVMALAALRVTSEETRRVNGQDLDMIKGVLAKDRRAVAFHPGDLPKDPERLFQNGAGARPWLDGDYEIMHFAPPEGLGTSGPGLPHIRLDKALEFLFGDRL